MLCYTITERGGIGAIGGVCVRYIYRMTAGGILGSVNHNVLLRGLECLCELTGSIQVVYIWCINSTT